MRVLGLDVGTKRTGVALSDETKLLASPLTVIEAKNKKIWTDSIKKLVSEHEVESVVVGLPLNHHGEEGEDAKNIRIYIALLQEQLAVPVIEWDERFTTAQAERTLIHADVSRQNRKQIIDKVAASILLQSYLDSLRFEKAPTWDD